MTHSPEQIPWWAKEGGEGSEESVPGIVERLRRWDEYNCVHLPSHTVDLTDEAADLIERLTSALGGKTEHGDSK